MRIPKVSELRRSNIGDTNNPEIVNIDLISDFSPREIPRDIFDDNKELRRTVSILKRLCRNSYEYKTFIRFLKDNRGLFRCGIHPNITVWDGFNINIHHTPFTMEDICTTVLKKRIELKESIKMMDICQEVMMLHYLETVGLYPLCETCHEYAHGDTNDLFIPLNSLYGNPDVFFNVYKQYMTEALEEKFTRIQELSVGLERLEKLVPKHLMRQYIYIKYKNHELPSQAAITSALSHFL